MPIRITGMNSGLDTESIISELVKAKSTKKDKLTKAQKKLSYKQDAWKELNAKITKLYSKTINNLSYTTAYKQQKTTVSDTSVASVITGANASNGVQKLAVAQLAQSGYLTGAKLDGSYSSSTKLSELTGSGISSGDEVNLTVTTNGETTDLRLTGDSTIGDLVSQLKNAGLNANFDEKNQRFFISSKTTGKDADFALTSSNAGGFQALSALGINVLDAKTKGQYEQYAALDGDAKTALIEAETQKQAEAVQQQIDKLTTSITSYSDSISQFLRSKGYEQEDGTVDISNLDSNYDALVSRKETLSVVPDDETAEAKTAREAELSQVTADIAAYDTYRTNKAGLEQAETDKAAAEAKLDNDYAEIRNSVTADIDSKIAYAQQLKESGYAGFTAGATRLVGQDALIYLNGAEFTNSTNSFEINGLTINALKESSKDENGEYNTVTLTTADDYDAIYDTLKNFFKEYNELINEMDKLYNAESASGYEPLTDEEKDAMSDSEVEKWEQKIKDSILRRDSTLGEVSNLFKTTMMKGFEVNGKTMYLSSFGIHTMGYFSSAENERNAYHIDGDPDDENTQGESDVLKSMIANDPETVISFFTQLTRELYSQLGTKMKSNDYSSYNKVYNDKQMQEEYTSYTSKIAAQEKIITAAEDKYYKQFSAMETALAKLQSKESALSGLLGG